VDIKLLFDFFETELEKFRKENSRNQPLELYVPISYILQLGGKKLRPLLVLMACDLVDGKKEDAIHAALAIEVFHNFTLMHDDIMDNAPIRRGKATVHEQWNNNIAILSGDAMLVKAYQELFKLDPTIQQKVLEIFSKTALEVCEGQQLDMNFETLQNVSIPMYINMIGLKTAVLLGASLQIGALVGGATMEDAKALYDFGKNIGIAFQLQDDILDVYGNEENFGKKKGGDIIANKKTYLILKTLEIADRYSKEELLTWLGHPTKKEDETEKVTAVTKILDFYSIRELAKKEMDFYYQKGLKAIENLPCAQEKKQTLLNFASQLMIREI
jgi:geranylgeranyl diphosphate synthase type II